MLGKWGGGGGSDGYDGTKRPRMMESSPYFAVNNSFALDGYNIGSKRSHIMSSSPHFKMGGVGSSYQSLDSGFSGGLGSIHSFPVVRLRGLPFNCNDLDIIKFFMGLEIVDCLLVNKNGRFSGTLRYSGAANETTTVQLQQRSTVEAWSFDDDYNQDVPPSRTEKSNENRDKVEYTEVLKLRGLPYSVTKSDIVDFFGEFELSEDKVHIAYRSDGKATGEAYAEFPSAEMAKMAICKDKMTIGSRYVEVFPSTPDDARRAESRSRELNQ
ncbi:hypothetical protein Cni_G25639 [Canna indica]|uniref:RRM domain-containing protein n=1 Tax=Canna indica TaxID=4628 RepID=A0AAQ3QL86_9LILI|nr:hypothetical protein Cni_G25639 [Canna indica]